MEQIQKKLFLYLPALLTSLPLVPSTTGEITDCINEAAKGANKAPRNPPSCYFISSCTVSVTPSINTPKSSNDFIIFIISLISSLELNKGNAFPALKAPFPLIFLSNLLHWKLNCLLIQVNCL